MHREWIQFDTTTFVGCSKQQYWHHQIVFFLISVVFSIVLLDQSWACVGMVRARCSDQGSGACCNSATSLWCLWSHWAGRSTRVMIHILCWILLLEMILTLIHILRKCCEETWESCGQWEVWPGVQDVESSCDLTSPRQHRTDLQCILPHPPHILHQSCHPLLHHLHHHLHHNHIQHPRVPSSSSSTLLSDFETKPFK